MDIDSLLASPLSFGRRESLIFSRHAIEFYRYGGTLPRTRYLPSRFYGSSSPLCELVTLVGSRSTATTMSTAALTVTLYVPCRLIIFSPRNYHPCRFIWLHGPRATSSKPPPLRTTRQRTVLLPWQGPRYLAENRERRTGEKDKNTNLPAPGFLRTDRINFLRRRYCLFFLHRKTTARSRRGRS